MHAELGPQKNKKLEEEPGELLKQLEDEVYTAVTEGTEDLVLSTLINITLRSIRTGRELFQDPLQEPVFYIRHFRPWVQAALDDQTALENVMHPSRE
jgi:hypothetical protein